MVTLLTGDNVILDRAHRPNIAHENGIERCRVESNRKTVHPTIGAKAQSVVPNTIGGTTRTTRSERWGGRRRDRRRWRRRTWEGRLGQVGEGRRVQARNGPRTTVIVVGEIRTQMRRCLSVDEDELGSLSGRTGASVLAKTVEGVRARIVTVDRLLDRSEQGCH